MQIILYTTPSAYNTMHKVLNSPLTKEGHLIAPSNVLTPTIAIGIGATIPTSNYCYIPAFRRYYFIKDIIVDDEEATLILKVDALMSFEADIKNSYGRITRSGNMGNKYIIDEMVSTSNHFTTQVRKLGAGFTKEDNYIMCVGGSN